MGVSNLEARIKKLENTSQSEFGTPANTIFFPVRKLMLSEERSHDEDGVAFPVLVATWDKPAGLIFPETIRLIHNGTTVSLAGTATSYRMAGYAVGNTVTVNVTAIYAQGASSTVTAVKTITGDATPPSVPTNLTVAGGFRTLTLRWENPTAEDFSHVEIWESVSAPNLATAERIAQAYGTEFVRSNCAVLETRWFWIRALDVNGNFSDFTSVASGTTTAIAMEDVPENTISESMLISELASEINKIPVIEGDVNLINTVNLPDYEQRLADRINEINVDVHDELAKVSDAVADALGNTHELNRVVRDAGIVVNPDDGTVRIWGLDQANGRISNAEIRLDAAESEITSKVTLAEVDERIAGAVFGDAGELLLSGVDARISVVEESLDAVEGTLTEKASVVDVNALGGRIGTAESRLDGHDSEIALLATSQELDAVESRVTTAELNIDALEGSITQTVASSVTATQDKGELLAQGLVDAMLNDREAQADTKAKTQSALAIAESELYAHINDEMEAEAGQRLLLAVKVDNNLSAIQSEATARATADEAMASQITTLQGTVGANTAAIQTEQTARANADSAMASQIATLQATTGDNTAAIQIVEDVRTGEVNVFRQASAPTTGMITGDLWINNTGVVYRYEGGAWVSKAGSTVYDLLKTAIAQYVVKTQTATGDGKLKVAGFGLYNDSTTGSEFAVLADKFYVYAQKEDGSSYSNMQVFTVDATTTPPTVGINGNLIVDGSITGDKINAAAKIQLGDGGEFITGANTIVQMASGVITLDSEGGIIQVRNPANVATGDFVRIDTGDITTYKYMDGAYYPMKSLRRMDTGTGVANNATVTLNGRFPSQPEIFVSPCVLQSFHPSYSSQAQTLSLQATNVVYNASTGICTFKPVAQLIVSAGSGSTGATPANSGSTGTATYRSSPYYDFTFPVTDVSLTSVSLPANVGTINVAAKVYAQAERIYTQVYAGGDSGPRYRHYVIPHLINYTIYANIAGTNYVIGSGQISRPTELISLATEPTAYYINKNTNITLNNASPVSMVVWARFTPAAQNNSSPPYYQVAVWGSGMVRDPSPGISLTNYNRAWLAYTSGSYTLPATTVLASGTLNYMAIAE